MEDTAMDSATLAAEFAESIELTLLAHSAYANTPRDAIRWWDSTTPYAIHPIGCATTMLAETTLSAEIRFTGYQVLLWHDMLEDTSLPLPPACRPDVRRLVEEMTFTSFADELANLWSRSEMTKLLKLYDKTSQLLDAVWMDAAKWNRLVEHTHKLIAFVVEQHGELNIVRIARALAHTRADPAEPDKPPAGGQ
jgi:hypothetical protein